MAAGHRQCDTPSKMSRSTAGDYNLAGRVPTTAFRKGDFSALLGTQIGTDVYADRLWLARFMTRQHSPGHGELRTECGEHRFIRDPIAGNLVSNSRDVPDRCGGSDLPFVLPDPRIRCSRKEKRRAGSKQPVTYQSMTRR